MTFNRRTIFLRAHQLRQWNPTRNFAWALKFAWAEAKAGTLPDFAPAAIKVAKVEAIRREIVCIENQDRLSRDDCYRIDALRFDLAAIAA